MEVVALLKQIIALWNEIMFDIMRVYKPFPVSEKIKLKSGE